ncbi:MAG TPA: tetratricopeptide repeat protein [Verrucomicrobiota bacterium]|nr:tetratricopeptide repeat protein [Verrucomicrobiota bacterium]
MQTSATSTPAEALLAFGQKHATRLVTLLFTDMVDSLALKQRLGEHRGKELFDRHHQSLRDCLRRFPAAHEIGTAGDSFFLLFAVPSEAVAFALLLQARMRTLSRIVGELVQDRIGIHLGELILAENEAGHIPDDMHSVQIDIACRVMAMARGGQVLVTRPVFDSARQVLKDEDLEGVGALGWVSHGAYLLKGIEEPVEICEVGEAAIQPFTQPPASAKSHPHPASEGEMVLGWRPALNQQVPKTQWVLERQLGTGGFGEVWLGRHQTLKERRVFKFCFRAEQVRALKREVTLFRLLKEQLGEHPQIVPVRDVFFEEAPYYIVMDYAEGQDLRTWCEAQGGAAQVPMGTRLDLAAQAADVLQAAHDAGVIHRDLKPGNILISEHKQEDEHHRPAGGLSRPTTAPTPLVKLTDFGIGQVTHKELLDSLTKAGFTQTMAGQGGSPQSGTYLYMAPELLAGKPATIRSDIYSLGVVLYQMILGDFTRPVTIDWLETVEDPLLREDLSHCFAGNPVQRFGGAIELAKHLRALPERRAALARQQAELAARERAAYRRGVIRTAVLSALIVTVVSVLALTAWNQAIRATAARRDAEALSAFLTEVLESPDPGRDGRTITVEEVLSRAASRLDADLAAQPARRASFQSTLGWTYHALGVDQPAIPLLEKARDYYLAAFGPNHSETLRTMHNLATSYHAVERWGEALELRREVLEMRRKVNGPEHPDTAAAMGNLAISLFQAGHRSEALQLREQALTILRKVRPDQPATLRLMGNLAASYADAGRRDEALDLLEEVLKLEVQVNQLEHPDTLWAMNSLAAFYFEAGRKKEANELWEKVVTLAGTVLGPKHTVTLGYMNNLAGSYFDAGRPAEALKLQEEVVTLRREILGSEHNDTVNAMDMLASAHTRVGHTDQALEVRRELLKTLEKKKGPKNPDTLEAMNALGFALADAGRRDDALGLQERVLALSREVHGPEHPNTLWVMVGLASGYRENGQLDQAIKLGESGLELFRKVAGPEHPDTLNAMTELAISYQAANRLDDAVALEEKTLALKRLHLPPGDPGTLESIENLAICHEKAGRRAQAEALRRELAEIKTGSSTL